MLFVGLAGHHAERSTIAGRLLELGAIGGRIDSGQPPWDVTEQAVVVLDDAAKPTEDHWPGLHLVIGGSAANEPSRGEGLPDAGSPGRGQMPAGSMSAGTADVWLDIDGFSGGSAPSVDALWAGRLVPFEANLRNARRAPRRQHADLARPDPTWAGQAARLIGRLRHSVGRQIIRIDHIGSTSVPGLPAKELIDIQIVVSDLAAAARVAESARRAGCVHVPGQWFGTDRYGADHPEEVVVDADPGRPVNVNIRPVTAPIWRETLLFRDWLRGHDGERDAYAAMKRALASRPGRDIDDYGRDKMPWISAAAARAESWAQSTAWSPA